jgi:hypothetical protein
MSVKKKDKLIFGDYWSYIDQIEAMYEAAISRAEFTEQAYEEASQWAEKMEQEEQAQAVPQ